jgi:hypothetical protein
MNINYASLLPGLEGLARSLATVCKIRATTALITNSAEERALLMLVHGENLERDRRARLGHTSR